MNKTIYLLLSLAFLFLHVSRAQISRQVTGRDFSIPLQVNAGALPEAAAVQEIPAPSFQTQRNGVDPILALYLQSVLNDQRNNLGFKGLTAAMTLPGGGTWTGTSGLSSATDSVRPDMLFGIGSITKTIVAACILQLHEQGQLHLDDSLAAYLPAYRNIDSSITIRQLLNHSSGIYNFTDHPAYFDSVNANLGRIWTPEEVLARFVDAPYFPKGVSWAYSNTNYVLLGLIIEEVTGNTVGNEIRSRFLTPLGIGRTYYWPWEPLQGPVVHLWADLGTGSLTDLTALGLTLRALWSSAGAAGAYYSTAENMALWAHALYGGQVLADSTLQQMFTTIPLLPGVGYGLGVIEAPIAGRTCYGHGGDIIFGAQMYYSPTDTVSVAVITNDGNSSSTGIEPVVEALMNAYLDFLAQTTSTVPLANSIGAKVFPNPFSQDLFVEFDPSGPVSLSLYDLNGRLLHTITSPTGASLHWDGKTAQGVPVPAGCYLYELRAGEKAVRGKVVRGEF